VRTILPAKWEKTKSAFSLNALRNIRKAFPSTKIYFIHLPQKEEVANGAYLLDDIGKDIEEIGISYFPALKELHWKKEMFIDDDAHPNRDGYDNIRDGVSRYLFRSSGS
jgi:lysophospholipase L1-like esterase